MDFNFKEYSMEHFLLEFPHYSTLTGSEFIAKYETWLEDKANELDADRWISYQKSEYYD